MNYTNTIDTTIDTTSIFNSSFNDILVNSQFFLMNQTSDIYNENKFLHVSLLGKILVTDIITTCLGVEQSLMLVKQTNLLVNSNYKQLFITQAIYDQFYNTNNLSEFTIINNYDDLFSGFIRADNYYILANSSNSKFYVYLLIKQSESAQVDPFEFYGFINIGYLINPRGYTNEEIINYESQNGFQLKSDFKDYIRNTSIIKYQNKLFYINLSQETNTTSQEFTHYGHKIITNSNPINTNGFISLGLLNNISCFIDDIEFIQNKTDVLLLLNYNDSVFNANYQFSLWTLTQTNQGLVSNNTLRFIQNLS